MNLIETVSTERRKKQPGGGSVSAISSLEIGVHCFGNNAHRSRPAPTVCVPSANPRLLSFIDKDNNQIDILGARMTFEVGMEVGRSVVKAEDTRIAPKARIKRSYALTNYMELPARLYYEDKLLATIIN